MELRAGLSLAQDFELTPEVATRVKFFDLDENGAKGDAVAVQVAQTKRQLLFVADGSFFDETVAQRLRELAALDAQVAADIVQFVALERAIPGAFTGD